MEELSAKNNQLYQELTVQSSALEAIREKYAAEISYERKDVGEGDGRGQGNSPAGHQRA